MKKKIATIKFDKIESFYGKPFWFIKTQSNQTSLRASNNQTSLKQPNKSKATDSRRLASKKASKRAIVIYCLFIHFFFLSYLNKQKSTSRMTCFFWNQETFLMQSLRKPFFHDLYSFGVLFRISPRFRFFGSVTFKNMPRTYSSFPMRASNSFSFFSI